MIDDHGEGAASASAEELAACKAELARQTAAYQRAQRALLAAEEERTALLERAQQAQRLATIGRHVGGLGHDVNNVLQAILSLALLLPEEIAAVERGELLRLGVLRQGIEQILAVSRRGRDLTQELLRAGQPAVKRRAAVPLNALVVEVAELLRRTSGQHAEIELTLAADDPRAAGDATQLHQVLLNLCLNALDAMAGRGALRLTTRAQTLPAPHLAGGPELPAGRYAVVEVQDRGPGMSQEVLTRAFEPFFTTKLEAQGTGLGLAVALSTVRDHGGTVTLRSEGQRGTEATVWLPLLAAPPPVLVEPAQAERPQRQALGTLLVVDDEQLIRSAARRLLQRLGYATLLAECGEEALAIYARRKDEISLVLLDLAMPGMGGVETLQRLQAQAPDLKVVVCSGDGHESLPAALLRACGVAFLRKPFELDELQRTIQTLLAVH